MTKLLLAALLSAALAPAESVADPARLVLIPARMQQFVTEKSASEYVTPGVHKGCLVALYTVCLLDVTSVNPSGKDAIFQIASMTKPITAVGIAPWEHAPRGVANDRSWRCRTRACHARGPNELYR